MRPADEKFAKSLSPAVRQPSLSGAASTMGRQKKAGSKYPAFLCKPETLSGKLSVESFSNAYKPNKARGEQPYCTGDGDRSYLAIDLQSGII